MTPELRAALMRQPIVMVPGRTTTLTSEAVDAIAPIINGAISAARVTEHYHTKAVVERDALLAAADDLDGYHREDFDGDVVSPSETCVDCDAETARWLRARANEGTAK